MFDDLELCAEEMFAELNRIAGDESYEIMLQAMCSQISRAIRDLVDDDQDKEGRLRVAKLIDAKDFMEFAYKKINL